MQSVRIRLTSCLTPSTVHLQSRLLKSQVMRYLSLTITYTLVPVQLPIEICHAILFGGLNCALSKVTIGTNQCAIV